MEEEIYMRNERDRIKSVAAKGGSKKKIWVKLILYYLNPWKCNMGWFQERSFEKMKPEWLLNAVFVRNYQFLSAFFTFFLSSLRSLRLQLWFLYLCKSLLLIFVFFLSNLCFFARHRLFFAFFFLLSFFFCVYFFGYIVKQSSSPIDFFNIVIVYPKIREKNLILLSWISIF